MTAEFADIQVERSRATVLSKRVFTSGDWLLFSGLSLLRIGALAWFFFFCFKPMGWWKSEKMTFASASALLLIGLAGNHLRWLALPAMKRPVLMKPSQSLRVAAVTTCVPDLEPDEMIATTLQALVSLDYPHDTWLLDEGNSPSMQELCRSLAVQYFSRSGLSQYQLDSGPFAARSKHGNYNAWLDLVGFAKYDVMIGFDSDHVPAPEYASSVLGFFEDARVAYVQLPQVYRNQAASFIARGAAEETYFYYSATEMASYGVGEPVLTGCHNAQRLSALKEFGGLPDHAAEDLLQTVYYRRRGWRGVYVPEILATGLAPETWAGYLAQQVRWACSLLDIKFRHLSVLEGAFSSDSLIELLQGFGYLQDAVLAVGTLALFVVLLTTGIGKLTFEHLASYKLMALLLVMFITDLFRQRFYLQPGTESGIHWRAGLLRIAKWPFLLKALWLVIRNKPFQYVVTPKIRSVASRRMLLLPHATIAAVVSAAWLVGMRTGAIRDGGVHLCAATMVALSVGLIASEARHRRG